MPLSAVKITLAALLVLGAALLQPVTAKPTPQPDYCLALSGKAKGLCIAAHNAADRGAKNAAHKLAQAQEAACGDGIVTPELGEECDDDGTNCEACRIIFQTVFEDFESGVLDPAKWTTYSSKANGRIRVLAVNSGISPFEGTYHLVMDSSASANQVGNDATLTVQNIPATGAGYFLTFAHLNVLEEVHGMPSSFTGHVNGDGVSFSVDGTTFYTLISFTTANSPYNQYVEFSFDLEAAAAAAGVTFGPTTLFRFQQYDNFPIPSDGRAFDAIRVGPQI